MGMELLTAFSAALRPDDALILTSIRKGLQLSLIRANGKNAQAIVFVSCAAPECDAGRRVRPKSCVLPGLSLPGGYFVLMRGRSCSEAFLSAETCTSRASRNATAPKVG
jgi:hypothetical protein